MFLGDDRGREMKRQTHLATQFVSPVWCRGSTQRCVCQLSVTVREYLRKSAHTCRGFSAHLWESRGAWW